MKNTLQDQVLLITGAGSGIGKAVAMASAQHGAQTILVGRRTKPLMNTYDEIQAQGFTQATLHPLDLAKATPDSLNTMHNAIRQDFGQLNGLIHCAAAVGSLTPIAHYEPTQWLKIIQTNLNGPFLLTKTLLPLLSQSKKANILFTLGNPQEYQQAYWGAYGASKHALSALLHILADELEPTPHIKVFGVNPEAVDTPLRRDIEPAACGEKSATPQQAAKKYLNILTDLYLNREEKKSLIIDG